MRILFVSSSYPVENDKRFLSGLITAFVDRGHEVMVLAAHSKGLPLEQVVDGVRVKRFKYFPEGLQSLAYGSGMADNIGVFAAKFQVPFYVLACMLAVLRAVGEFKPDIVQVLWGFPQGFAVWLASRISSFHFAVHLFGADVFLTRRFRMPFLVSLGANAADLVTTNSVVVNEAALALGVRNPVVRFFGGFDAEKFSGESVERFPFKIFSLGRFVERKGFKYLVRAMPLILERFPSATLEIGGDGPLRAGLVSEIDAAGVSDSVRLIGVVSEDGIADRFSSSSVFVLPSVVDSVGDTEGGVGVVLLEAMAVGTPVVASRVGGIPDLVEDGVNGLLVSEKSPGEIAYAVCRLFSDSVLSSGLSLTGKGFVKSRFSYDFVAGEFELLYGGTK